MLSLHVRRCVAAIFAALALIGGFASPGASFAAAQATPSSGPGYWLFGADGGVFPFGRGAYEGGLANTPTNAPVVGGAVTADGLGYWLASADGGVFTFGTARFRGAMAGRPHARIVSIAAAPDGNGYWLVAADGGVYAFGSARYQGGMGGRPHAPIAAVAATPSGRGYWLVATDGAVYAFGDAPYLGGVGTRPLAAPVVALVPSGPRGYWLASADGGVFALGDAPWLGGAAGRPHAAIVGMAALPNGVGYWLVAGDGGVFSFGNARYFGGVGSSRLNRGVVGIASGDGVAVPQAPAAPASTSGFDISWPQCGRIHPAPPYGFGVVGVTGGHVFSANPCLAEQWRWARTYGSFAAPYINSNTPNAIEYLGYTLGAAHRCGINSGCVLDLWGRRAVDQALRDAGSIQAPMWWLDVETGNEWLPDTAANAVVLRAMIDELQRSGRKVGIYSTAYQWNKIAGAYAPGLPTWIPGAPADNPASYCADHSFGGGTAWMAQSGDADFDTDRLCAAGLAAYREAFAPPAPLEIPTYADPLPVAKAPPTVAPPAPKAAPARVAPAVHAVTRVAGPRTLTVRSRSHRWQAWALAFAGLAVEVRVIARVARRRRTTWS